MKKKIVALVAMIILLLLNLYTIVSAAGLQDPYKAYGLEKGDTESFREKIIDNPPDVIAIRPYMILWRQFEMNLLNMDTLIIEKGGEAEFRAAAQGTDTTTASKMTVNITSDIVFRYEDENFFSASIDHNTKFKTNMTGQVVSPDFIMDETSNNISNVYGYNREKNGYPAFSLVLTKDDASIESGNHGMIYFVIEGVQYGGGGLGIFEIGTDASATAGEKDWAVPAVLVIGLAGAAAAAAGAAAAGVSGAADGDSDDGEEGDSSYKMVIYKDFGDKIRIGDEPVFVQARMVEVNARGAEIERPDLTEKIEIFSPDNMLTVGGTVLTGSSMQASVQIPRASAYGRSAIGRGGAKPEAGTVSFRFTGEGGAFQNNVRFKIIGEGAIKLAADVLPILGTSRESIELEYELVDFLMEPEVTLEYNEDLDLFKLELAKNKQGKDVIAAAATEKAGQMNFHRFVHRYPVEITAKNDKETIKEKFELHLCYEGIGTAFKDCKNNTAPDEILLQCFTDSEKEKREEKAYHLPLAVMRWNSASKQLEPDPQLAAKLQLEFTADTRSRNLPVAEAVKAVEEAEILAEVKAAGSSPVKADLEKKPAVYMIYPSKSVAASAVEIEMLLTVSAEDAEFEQLHLKTKLKPQNDYRAMIEWFINYGKGTFADKYLKIGDVSIYHGALDFIEDRVYCESNMPYKPKTTQNHYEDGKYDVSRPNYVYLQDVSMPHQIGEFKKIQSLHHELCHTIEHQHGDTGGDESRAERHTYFIQYLAEVVKALADMEKGAQDVESAAQDAIKAYYNVFFNSNNAEPQTFSWFGVKYITQHKLFERYADFDTYAGDSNIPDSRKQLIAKTFREKYFPGNLQGRRSQGSIFKETTGPFKGAAWLFKCSTFFKGFVNGIVLEHPDYKFTVERTPQWIPGTLKIKAVYNVESIAAGKTDTLEVELDGGSFDSGDYHYPKISKFTVTWRATYKISDCIMGQPKAVTEAVKS